MARPRRSRCLPPRRTPLLARLARAVDGYRPVRVPGVARGLVLAGPDHAAGTTLRARSDVCRLPNVNVVRERVRTASTLWERGAPRPRIRTRPRHSSRGLGCATVVPGREAPATVRCLTFGDEEMGAVVGPRPGAAGLRRGQNDGEQLLAAYPAWRGRRAPCGLRQRASHGLRLATWAEVEFVGACARDGGAPRTRPEAAR